MEEIRKDSFTQVLKFDNISEKLLFDNISEKLLDVGEEFFFAKNKILVSPGDVPDGFYYLKDGRVKACTYSPKGNENILGLIEKGCIFLESNTLFSIPSDCYFKTIEPSNLLFFKKEDLLNLLKTDFDVTLLILQSITCKFLANLHSVNELLVYDSEWRICHLLLTFADNFGIEIENKIKLNIKISQQFISDMLGVTRGTTIKMINKLKELNLIEQTNGYYFIKDLQRLKNHQAEICLHKGI
ncbi:MULTISPECIES: Crp/Fnr family transcriptional regulator [Dehalobacter]|jgi:CRP/FNR family transcriptional regulator|uniref:Cyclic nucleotide-binding domain-containing protein n=1 Tax=Dehalobacter restrictus TaxID=55583 RepID=A0A857DF32_9FIRM|nr:MULTISPECIES: Crp/Fnr family transcriptional regulator [Dehalobacter]MCG1025836.1 Crp/Fnr family transcriptional regulator [Dehalobacter sp.]OCZ50967.1 cyclic nucleotide-binding protein [Dehalobacter sp. TeCB1]QGZ99889.1 cyclic nucleotide-binding domain-containing protein [Dehalobacter restrictus]